jgi:electron transfer flavoprotein alpha subunit
MRIAAVYFTPDVRGAARAHAAALAAIPIKAGAEFAEYPFELAQFPENPVPENPLPENPVAGNMSALSAYGAWEGEALERLEALYRAAGADVFIVSGGTAAAALCARLAARLGISCVPDTHAILKEGGRFCAVRGVYSSNLECLIPLSSAPCILSSAPPAAGEALVLVGGRGLGTRENFVRLERLALRLGGRALLTRAAALDGMGGADGTERIVGQSGMSIAPRVCAAFGVSGAAAFMAGAERAEKLIAVNIDADAPIFGRADIGVTADAEAILTELEKQYGIDTF